MRSLELVGRALTRHLAERIADGTLPDQAVAIRVLGMPRTPGADKGVPFRDIPHGRS